MFRATFYAALATLALAGCTAKTTEPMSGATANPAASTATTTPDAAALAGEWRILTLNGTALPTEFAAEAMLNFDAATNKLAGTTGCNRLMGTYSVSGSGITFGPMAATRMACPPNNPEASLLTVLGSQTLTYQLTGNNLTLLDGPTPVVTLSR